MIKPVASSISRKSVISGLWASMLCSMAAFVPYATAAAENSGCPVETLVQSSLVGGEILIEARLATKASRHVVWNVVTDYANASKFIRHLKQSHATLTGKHTLRVTQIGRVNWGPFSTEILTEYEVHLEPQAFKLEGKLLTGNVDDMRLRAEMVSTEQGTELRYTNHVRPQFWMPLTLAESMLTQRAQDSFEDLQAEISRRANQCPIDTKHRAPP